MEAKIHPTSIVGLNTELGAGVEIEAFCYIGFSYDEVRSRIHPPSDKPPIRTMPSNQKRIIIGEGSFIGPHTIIGPGSVIGRNCLIEAQTYIGSNVVIGDNTFVRYACQVYRNATIGSDCVIGGFICKNTVIEDHVEFYGSCIHHAIGKVPGTPVLSPTIREGAFIGWGALIVGGVCVGRRATIKVAALITHDVADEEIVDAYGRK